MLGARIVAEEGLDVPLQSAFELPIQRTLAELQNREVQPQIVGTGRTRLFEHASIELGTASGCSQ